MLAAGARRLRLDEPLRQGVASLRRAPETLHFTLRGRPAAGDAILLAAVGRSGSTWLADLLSAAPGLQQIFEPLHPAASAEYRRLSGWQARAGGQYRRVYLRPGQPHPGWDVFWRRVLRGQVRDYRTDYQRTARLPRRFLVKCVRANLMLGYVYDAFQPQIVLLLRHPCAVVYSRLARVRRPWPAQVADLLADEALVEDYLRPWLGLIEGEKDLLGAHALWWAVENRVALQELATRPHRLLFYEALAAQPADAVADLAAWLHLPAAALEPAQVRAPSRVTSGGAAWARDASTAWQQGLTPAQQARILAWAERLEIPYYGAGPLPRPAAQRGAP